MEDNEEIIKEKLLNEIYSKKENNFSMNHIQSGKSSEKLNLNQKLNDLLTRYQLQGVKLDSELKYPTGLIRKISLNNKN